MLNDVLIHDAKSRCWLLFRDPVEVVQAARVGDVRSCLEHVERAIAGGGCHAAGFLSYEAAPAFDDALEVRPGTTFPLLWFGLYARPEMLERPPFGGKGYCLGAWTPAIDRAAYSQSIASIKERIAWGETYQVNYTLRLRALFTGAPTGLFLDLCGAQQADYAAYVDTGRFVICSVSPELFFRLDAGLLTSRPMKGTAARGRTLDEDMAQAEWLRASEKNRAENIMIVDMIRNDMGRVADIGTVRAVSLFDVERYPTLWQMTSTVIANTNAPVSDVLAALFPCASITGAPKPRTMHIIAQVEPEPRRIYTGCIGFISPGPTAQFNVAIRTVVVDKAEGRAEYGVGGGITWDSETGDEYAECEIKARVLTARRPDFALLESMRWTPEEGYFLLDRHLKRLADSAAYFGIPADATQAKDALDALPRSLKPQTHKVRLLVAQDGAVSCEASVLAEHPQAHGIRLGLAAQPVDSHDVFLFHKTTRREVYDAALAASPECDDVLLWNERGELTETCTGNIVAEIDGGLVTPPVTCGLLAGTYRAMMLKRGRVREQTVMRDALARCTRLWTINSVREWREATLR